MQMVILENIQLYSMLDDFYGFNEKRAYDKMTLFYIVIAIHWAQVLYAFTE